MTGTASSQTFLETVRSDIQSKISNLDLSQVPTGILYDKSLHSANLTAYGNLQGAINPATQNLKASKEQFFMALEELEYTDYQNRYPSAEVSYNANENTFSQVNIGIINTDINVFKEDAVAIGALQLQTQGTDTLIYDNPSSSISPYKTFENSFIAAPLKKKRHFKDINFVFDNAYWIETAGSKIKK